MASDEEVRAQLEDDDASKMAHFYGRGGDVGAVGELFERLAVGLEAQGEANIVLSRSENGEWVGMATFGKEAPDSDMVGGATHGMGTLDEVLATMVEEGRW